MIKPSTDTEPAAENEDKIILDLCGGTGSWSKPYKEAGYDVTTPLIVTNSDDYRDVKILHEGMVTPEDKVLEIVKE